MYKFKISSVHSHVVVALLLFIFAAAFILLYGNAAQAQNGDLPAPVQTYYVPMGEDNLLDVLSTLNSEASSPVQNVISIVVGGDNTLIYYDHWEDGYEVNLSDPQQETTEIWGDGDPSNGAPPAISSDTFGAGTVIVLRDQIPVPREGDEVLFDGRDFIGSTSLLAVTRAGWPVNDPGSQLAGAIEVYNTDRFGTEFVVPIGQDLASDDMFEYVALFVMAGTDDTTLEFDNGDGVSSQTLARGESALLTDIQTGATLSATNPVQVYIATGDIEATYEARFYTLFSRDQWSDSYFSAVSTTAPQDGPTDIFIFNPHSEPLTINYDTTETQETVEAAPNTTRRLTAPQGSGTHFYTEDGRDFFAIATIDSDAANNQIFDWGFTLIPERLLSPSALVGWGAGNLDRPCNAAGAEHPPASPVWVLSTADATVLVDYDGNPATGDLEDANGNLYDQSIDLNALEAVQLFDNEEFNGDFDQTGTRVYVIDDSGEANVIVTWGQDPTRGTSNSLCNLDLGTNILPLPNFVAAKSVEIVEGGDDGEANPNDTLEYTITIEQKGPSAVRNISLFDEVPEHTTYVEGTVNVKGPTEVTINDDSTGTPFPFDDEPVILGDLNVGEEFVITFQVTIDAPLPDNVDQVTNQAIVQAGDQEARPQVTTPVVQRIDLVIEKTDSVEQVLPGETVVYELTYYNVGYANATGVVIEDTVPENTTFDAGASSDGWNCPDGARAGTTCTYEVGSLPAQSDEASVDFALQVDSGLEEGTLIENVAIISDDGTHGEDENPENNQDDEDTPVPVYDASKGFELTSDEDGDGNVDLGDTITYRIVITQTGSVPIEDIMVSDTLGKFENYVEGSAQMVSPEAMEIEDDATGSPFPLDEDGYEIGTLAEGEVAEITFEVLVDECFVDYLRNDATIVGSGVEKMVSTEVRLDTGADLVLMEADRSTSVSATEIQLVYMNVGNGDAEDVAIMMTLPAGTRLNSFDSDDGWSCDDGECMLEVGDLASMSLPETTTVVIVQAADARAEDIRIEISSASDSDPSPGNNFVDIMR